MYQFPQTLPKRSGQGLETGLKKVRIVFSQCSERTALFGVALDKDPAGLSLNVKLCSGRTGEPPNTKRKKVN